MINELPEMEAKQNRVSQSLQDTRDFLNNIDCPILSENEMDGRALAGEMCQSGGGVARNLADALGKLNLNPLLISVVADDLSGSYIIEKTMAHLSLEGMLRSNRISTASCMVLCDHTGECKMIVGDMEAHRLITKDHVRQHESDILNSSLVVMDGNISVETMEYILHMCHSGSVPVWFEPTNFPKAAKPFSVKDAPLPTFISPNYREFQKIFQALRPSSNKLQHQELNDSVLEECVKYSYQVAEHVENVIITLGRRGVLIVRKGQSSDTFFKVVNQGKLEYQTHEGPISHRLYKPEQIWDSEVVNVSGAGDCFAGGFIAAMLKGHDEIACVQLAFKCSTASLKSPCTVPARF